MNTYLDILYVGSQTKLLEKLGNEFGVSLTVLRSDLNAINYLNTNKQPDAIICDYNLPGNNGLYLFDWIRERSVYDVIPFILLGREFSSDLFKLTLKKKVDDYYVSSKVICEDLVDRIRFLTKFKSRTASLELTQTTKESYQMPLSKRLFDISFASVTLLLAAPFLLLIAIAIVLESKGKVYYTAKRVGRKTFDFYKLRSMRTGSDAMLKKLAAEKNQYNNVAKVSDDKLDKSCPRCSKMEKGESCSPVLYVDNNQICDYWYNNRKIETSNSSPTFVKISNDPRVTRVGKFIRNTSIDELPQLINVIKGDMSIVGNRPLPVYEAELLTEDMLSKRFLAPAGITGLWQVELRGKGGIMSEAERKNLDNEYAEHFIGDNYSFWYDMKLILRTIPALLQKESV